MMMTSFEFTLEASSPGTARTGSSVSFDSSGTSFAADLTGQLDCATGVFHADLSNGATLVAAPLPISAAFSGTLDATLGSQRLTLEGTWSLLSSSGFGKCTGPWSASL
jgi:hypothetical protein